MKRTEVNSLTENNNNKAFYPLLEGSIVIPGDVIGEAENIKSGSGTTIVDKKIIATTFGILHYGRERKLVWVEPIKQIKLPRKNDLVIGEVISSGSTIASIKTWFIIKKDKNSNRVIFIQLEKPFSANLHISQLGIRTEALSKVIKIGDVILAKVIMNHTLPLNIAINNNLLGIVAARCSSCGAPLIKKQGLYCEVCNRKEIRKISSLYDYEKFMTLIKTYKPKRYLVMELE